MVKGMKTKGEGRVHTPALTEQCPVAGEPQVQRGALCIAQLGKVYPFQMICQSVMLLKI